MDATRFDELSRTVSSTASRRGLVAALTSGLLAVLPVFRGGEDAAAKKKRKKRKKRKKQAAPVPCTGSCAGKVCGDDGCGGSCGECAANQVCAGGSCCTPEPTDQTCAGRCGVWINNCGQRIACAECPAAKQCLSNGTCALPCTGDANCQPGTGCTCADPNTEGGRYCVGPIDCLPEPPTCSSTAQCPPNYACYGGFGCCFIC